MPSYDFHCEDCGSNFEVFVPISKRDEVCCEQCGSETVTQRVTAFFVAGAASSCSGAHCSSCAGCGV